MISLKPVEVFTMNPLGFTTQIRLENYIDAWVKGKISIMLLNTIIVTFMTIVIVILFASPAGFALSKLKIKGEKLIYNYFLLGLIIPIQAVMIPLMKLSNMTNMTNKLSTLIIIYSGWLLCFPILLYTGFYKSIPTEVIEAARIDGCNVFSLFRRIIFPMTKSANLMVAIFTGMVPWRDFFIPLIFTTENTKRTLAIGLFNFQGSYFNDWTIIFAMVVLMSLPLILLYLFSQKAFISGVMAGSIKG
ncbi:MAG: carbohydrate ABC transporter permease [Clostridiales bacterium]|nr:carbohydrate ABC transporter permease [Clostridiales bacterium]